ncbi:transcriptional regulator [Staphylococcus condimenti]|uniref:helix-turn-helix domain-containing protein n=1 Tax=Staphylococcus condimenti TaxID=70255 RepID=UPI000947498F|nr:helix-turn-helix transcriptional regulator [Staphylococcus condimenti]APR61448.1 transcriptional regulator [Staphylococcus condimenti]MDK8646460.1 helix-turn-helix transcriptional regulator [Staphylococcus condimenti]
MTLGKKIKNHRLEQGLTQTEYGKKLGAVKSLVSHWENDKNVPNPKRLKLIADELNITVAELLKEGNSDEK